MKLICPSCAATHSADAWLNDAVARQCLILAGSMQHDISSRCFAYLSLFRPHGRALHWRKVLKLLAELQTLVSVPDIQWEGGPARMSSMRAWGIALDRVIEHPPKRLPLKSHGYLKAIAYEIADELDKQNEVRRNQSERNGTFRGQRSEVGGQKSEVRGQEPERIFLDVDEMKKIADEKFRKK